MSRSAVTHDVRIDPFAVVTNSHSEIACITEVHFQLIRLRMEVRISDGFTTDAVDFVADDWMHLLRRALHRKGKSHRGWDTSRFGGPLKGLLQIVLLRGGR